MIEGRGNLFGYKEWGITLDEEGLDGVGSVGIKCPCVLFSIYAICPI